MKRLLYLLPLSILLLYSSIGFTPQLVSFGWTYPHNTNSWSISADYFLLYTCDDITVPVTNWTYAATISALNPDGTTATNFAVPVVPGQHFFYMRSSNSWWGIVSAMISNITNTPPIPLNPQNLKIRKGTF